MTVSIIMPNHNGAAYIADALRSLTGSLAVIREIIVIDNASSDGSCEIVAALGIPKVRIIRNSANVGAARGRHQAIGEATGAFLSFLDSDDLLSPGAVERGLGGLISAGADMSIYTMMRLEQDGVSTRPFLPPLTEQLSGKEAFRRTLGPWRIHPMGVIRRSVYDQALDGFEFHGHADDEVITRRLFLASRLVVGNDGRYFYRDNPKPVTLQRVIGQNRTDLRVLQFAIDHREDVPARELSVMRNHVVRNLAGLTYRAVTGGEGLGAARRISAAVRKSRAAWRFTDLRYYFILIAVRLILILASLRPGSAGGGPDDAI